MSPQFRINHIAVFAIKRGLLLGLIILCGYFVVSFIAAKFGLFDSSAGIGIGFRSGGDSASLGIRPRELQQSANIDVQSWDSDLFAVKRNFSGKDANYFKVFLEKRFLIKFI